MRARKKVQESGEVREGFTHKGCDEERPERGKHYKKEAFIPMETTFRRNVDISENTPTECMSAIPPIAPECVPSVFRKGSKSVVNWIKWLLTVMVSLCSDKQSR